MTTREDSATGLAARSRLPWWLPVLAAAYAGYYGLLLYGDLTRPEPTGVALRLTEAGLTIRTLTPGSPGERAGLEVGDRLLTANDLAILTRPDWHAVEVNFAVGTPVALEVARAGRNQKAVLTLRRAGRDYWSSAPAATLLTARIVQAVTLVLALIVAFKRPRDPAARAGAWALATLAVYSLAWQFQLAALWRQLPWGLGLALWIPAASSFVVTTVIFAFFGIFPRRLIRSPLAWLALCAPAVPSLILQLQFALRVVYHPERAIGFPDWTKLHSVVSLGYGLAALGLLIIGYRGVSDVTDRRRVRVILVGSLVGLLGMLPPATAHSWRSDTFGDTLFASPMIAVGVVLGLALPLSFAYAILRHRLFDVTFIVRRGLQYALARRLLDAIVPAIATAFLVDLWINRQASLTDVLWKHGGVYAALAGLVVLARVRRKRWLAALDRRFFREQYNAQRLLRAITDEVHAASSFADVAPRIVSWVEAALHPEFVGLMVRDGDANVYRAAATAPGTEEIRPLPAASRFARLLHLLQRPLAVPLSGDDRLFRQLPADEVTTLRQARIELLVPVGAADDTPRALLVLGPKRSEEPYSSEDEDLLDAVSHSLALLLARAPAVSHQPEVLEECPECRTCYDTGTHGCPEDGAVLTPVLLPRLLGGRYRLMRRVGRGGMGTVYAAVDTALERPVAAKVLREDLTDGREAAIRFQAEARLLAGLVHPHIVTIHDIGVTPSGRGFFVMELLEGFTLRAELQRLGRLSPLRAFHILRDVGAAVDAAHRRQVIHRDLKPENIWLCRTESGELAKVLDFGLARAVETSLRSALTGAGVIAGTPAYMAPEHLRGGAPSPDWDLWAFAVVAHEVITGALPAAAIGGPDVTPAVAFSSGLGALFARALAPTAFSRPTSALEFLSELEPLLMAHELPT